MIRARAKSAYGIARFRLLAGAFRPLPLQPSYALARWHGRRHLARHRDEFVRRRAIDMAWRLGATTGQAEAWLERYFELASSDELDRHLFGRMSASEIEDLIELRGLEHLDEALRLGRGAILCAGHVWGHFTLFTALALWGYPLSILGFPELPGLDALVVGLIDRHRTAFLRERLGVQMLRMSEFGVAVKAQRALSANRVVTMEIDQSHSRPLVPIDFLGSTGYFPMGCASLAEASGAPLLHFWVHRAEERWLPQVAEIGPPFYATDGAENTVHHCAKLIERSVRSDPASWSGWLYRRRFVWDPLGGAPATELRAPVPLGI